MRTRISLSLRTGQDQGEIRDYKKNEDQGLGIRRIKDGKDKTRMRIRLAGLG